jgi:hypothetical protein
MDRRLILGMLAVVAPVLMCSQPGWSGANVRADNVSTLEP